MADKSGNGNIGQGVTRAFIAIGLPAEVKELIAVHIERLKGVVKGGVKWSDPSIAHLTLAFIGNVTDARLNLLSQTVSAVAAGSPLFSLITGTLGVFPNARRPRVVWMGLKCNTQLLSELYSRLQEALRDEGFPAEERAFKPHVTLGRARGKGSIALEDGRLAQQPINSIEFLVREIVLMSSVLTPRGPIHTPIHTAPLSGIVNVGCRTFFQNQSKVDDGARECKIGQGWGGGASKGK